MTRIHSALAVALVGLVAGGAALHAVSPGHLYGKVKDENGQPVPGVRVLVTLPGSSYRTELVTGGDGGYTLTLTDAARTYECTLEKDGFQPVTFPLKVAIGSHEHRDFEILSAAEARRRGPAGEELAGPQLAVKLFNEGAEASQMGDAATARAKFIEAAGIDPTLAAAHTALARLDLNEQNWAGAAAHAEKALALDAADVKALRILHDSCEQLGDQKRARAAAERLAALDPKAGAEDLHRDGVAKYNSGDTEAARQLFERALAIDGEHARSHYMLALCLAGSDAAAAREHFETFLRLAPADPDAATAREMLKYLK